MKFLKTHLLDIMLVINILKLLVEGKGEERIIKFVFIYLFLLFDCFSFSMGNLQNIDVRIINHYYFN